MKRTLLSLIPKIVGAAILAPVAAHAQVVLVPAPTPYHEEMPAPRPGHAWHHGYWRWEHGQYAWLPGGWSPEVVMMPGTAQMPVAQQPPPPPRVERLSADALFPFGRGDVSDIRPAGLQDIAQIAAQLRASPFGHVEVLGYTDRIGSAGDNLALSKRRANAVREVFIQHGVPADKIRAEGLGSQDPVTQCGNMSADALVKCLQPDRRVEIVTYVRDDLRWRQ